LSLSSLLEPTGKAKSPPQGLRLIALGGLGEIGMNCMVLEWEDEILIVDCGIMFSDLDHFGVQFVIPDFSYLRERKEKVKGILLTHGHEDHIGAVPFLLKAGVNAPIYASDFTSRMLKQKLDEYGLSSKSQLITFKMGERFKFKHFAFEAVPVNHSIVDAAALFIDTPLGKIIHTGDFKIDPTPYYGSMIDLERFRKAGDEGVLLMMSDSTNVDRHTHSMSENRIYQNFEQLFAAAQGLTLVATFASNVARMGQVMELARKMGKRVALSGRGMEQNARLAQEAGYLKDASTVLISLDEIDHYPRHEIVVLSTGSQAEQGSALTRVAFGEHKLLQLQQGDTVLMSSRYIPGNEKAIGRMINHLFHQGATVLYEAIHEIHVSGHATRPELKQMIELCRPHYFLPVHGEYRHLVQHSVVAKEAGVSPERVVIAVDGDVVELDRDRIRVVDHFEEPRVLIEGRDGNDISKLVLKERRHLGEKGVVFALLIRNAESRHIVAGPEVISRGLVSETLESWMIDEARNCAKRVVQRYSESLNEHSTPFDLGEEVRVELRRFFNANIGKKPTVIPLILDV
jgi:ribonuclease J